MYPPERGPGGDAPGSGSDVLGAGSDAPGTGPDALGAGPDAPGTVAGRTGQPRVDAALDQLERLGGLDPADQVAGYTEVHRQLHATLAALDEGR